MPYTEEQLLAAAEFWVSQLPNDMPSEIRNNFRSELVQILECEAGRNLHGFNFGTNHACRADTTKSRPPHQSSIYRAGNILMDAGKAAGLAITDKTFKLGVVCRLVPQDGTVGIIHSVNEFLKTCKNIRNGDQSLVEIIYRPPGLEPAAAPNPP